jgi:VWFA-related protein
MRTLRLFYPFLTAIVAICSGMTPAFAQAPDAMAPAGATVLHTGTQLVIVDVTVEDKNGHPIHGLKREDFAVTESQNPQAVPYFEEHTNQTAEQAGQELPPMPPGTFTDYTSVPPNGALNILLLDSLNTPTSDQAYVRDQLRQYVRKAKPGTRIAIFGLSRSLFLLQGFSSDQHVLKDAVEHKLIARSSSLLDDPTGSGSAPDAPSDITSSAISSGNDADMNASLSSVLSAMREFEAQENAFQTQLRIQYTLDAFNLLAHYLSAFPGRKNLIWFSGSFPLDILPDPTLNNGFSVMENNDPEFRETTNLLSRAQVAVYPIDARGLMADPTFSAATGKRDLTGKGSAAFSQSQDSEHMTMSQIAEETGGKAFYNTNDLATSVQSAIDSGSNYYTLMYSPRDRDWNGEYRQIRVALNGNLQAAGYHLTYRRGYYADDPNRPSKSATNATTTAGNIASTSKGDTYARAAMAHGAPTPEDILFKVRVLPHETSVEQTLAPTNNADPIHPIKPPFRLFDVDIAAVADDFKLTLDPDGRHTGAIEFTVLLYDNDGLLLNATGKTVQLDLTADTYKRFLTGVKAFLQISVPVKGGDDFLRIGIHDIPSHHFGVVEIPIASVARLAPLPAAAAATSPAPQQTQAIK